MTAETSGPAAPKQPGAECSQNQQPFTDGIAKSAGLLQLGAGRAAASHVQQHPGRFSQPPELADLGAWQVDRDLRKLRADAEGVLKGIATDAPDAGDLKEQIRRCDGRGAGFSGTGCRGWAGGQSDASRGDVCTSSLGVSARDGDQRGAGLG